MEIRSAAFGAKLRELYNKAPNNEKVAMIHLFGVKYGKLIKSNYIKISDIIEASGISHTYTTELNKGVKLSNYVYVKEDVDSKYFND